jgi:SAM-dependent methyltransferase
LWEYPAIKRFLFKKCPEISLFIEGVTTEFGPTSDAEELAAFEDTLVWTIADLLVYNKCPEVYDLLEFHDWDFNEVTGITPLDGKVVVEGGAGTGQVTLRLAQRAKQVYAVEPVTRLRQFIRDKVQKAKYDNIYVLDGFLHSIPLPENSADIFITSHALGWHLEDELPEFERVVKPGGYIIHCPGTAASSGDDPTHTALVSLEWGYEAAAYQEPDGTKRKYWVQVQ